MFDATCPCCAMMHAGDWPRRALAWPKGLPTRATPQANGRAGMPARGTALDSVPESVDIVAIEKRVAIARWRRDLPVPARLPG
jgi:hypothetical protein